MTVPEFLAFLAGCLVGLVLAPFIPDHTTAPYL